MPVLRILTVLAALEYIAVARRSIASAPVKHGATELTADEAKVSSFPAVSTHSEAAKIVVPASASFASEVEGAGGNRGTGLQPGSWKLDGGVVIGGINFDETFVMYMDVASIDDDEVAISVFQQSFSWGAHLERTYFNIHGVPHLFGEHPSRDLCFDRLQRFA